MSTADPPYALAVVGAGPRGVGVLERIGANAAELLRGRRLVVHLVDPFPAGAGRVWRYDQSPLLRMNSMPEDVTVFTDDTVEIDGPVRPGPSLIEWARPVRTGGLEAEVDDSLRAELDALQSDHFPTRRLQSAYLAWFHRKVRAELPPGIDVVEHRTRAVRLEDGEPQTLWLEDRAEPLKVDAVLFTVGHLDAEPDERESALAEFAVRNDLAMDFAVFADAFADTSPGEIGALVARAVPIPEDRLDLDRLDRPMEEVRSGSAEEFGKELREYVEADLSRRADSEYSADLGAFTALLSVMGQLPVLLQTGRLDAASQLSDLDGWFLGFFSYFASGPPPRRLEELLALQEAGIVSFLGADIRVTADEGRQVFVASGAGFPGETEARTLVEARLPEPSITRASDVLLRRLRDGGALGEETVLDGEGRPHQRRFALGPHTSARSAGALTRPEPMCFPFGRTTSSPARSCA